MDLSNILTAVDGALTVASPYVLASFGVMGVAILIWRIKTPILQPVVAKVSETPKEEPEIV